jgi:hypothetical protein
MNEICFDLFHEARAQNVPGDTEQKQYKRYDGRFEPWTSICMQ